MITVYFDGACEPKNPGGTASYGVVIHDCGKEVYRSSRVFIPKKGKERETSNNVAEYSGIIDALEWLIDNFKQAEMIEFYGDSMLVICQMFGDPKRHNYKWKIKSGFYVPLAYKAKTLLEQFPRAFGHWIPREENTIADELSKAELVRLGIRFKIQPRHE